ncbi:ATP-binding protein [Endozoicomonas arenosclerae]|uniref:ATP-binding protein n=1 Tax=Endozoicomonas arenosclerae TaxID=1633495 RepID=UPI0007802C3D|nr:ATP-binding protein [Endozoicomonas arenosclerae]
MKTLFSTLSLSKVFDIKNSLRLRVLLASGIMLLVSLILVMLSVMASFESAQFGAIRKELAADANVLLTAARIEEGRLVMPDKLPDEKFNQVESPVLGIVYDMSGNAIWRSRSTLDEVIHYVPDNDGEITEFDLSSDPTGKYFFYDIDVSLDGIPLIFVTLTPATEYFEVLNSFRRSLLFWLLFTALGMLLVVWLGMQWSLHPIRQLTRNLRDIESGSSDRLEGEYPRELTKLTAALNQLLNNERSQRERYRDAMADLAHSLKTPLAVLQTVQQSEDLQKQSGDAPLPDKESIVEEQVQRMNQIISYQLQRAVTRQKGLVKNHINVQQVIERITRTLDKVYHHKHIQLDSHVQQGCEFTGEEQDLMEIMGNMLENAYKLCLQNVRVSIASFRDKRARLYLELVIEDDGPGVPADRRNDILKRGVRADSRTPGQGIGLAIAMEIIDSYEGQLTIEDSELGGALFRVKLYS